MAYSLINQLSFSSEDGILFHLGRAKISAIHNPLRYQCNQNRIIAC